MLRRIVIFVISLLLGLSLAGMAAGVWPELSWVEGVKLEVGEMAGDIASEEIMKLAGVVPAEGRGIRLTVEDAKVKKWKEQNLERLLIHERDLLLIVNELFAAGAEAVAINGERFVATTEVRCVGPAIRINGKNTVPPYVIEALGDAEVLKQSILMMGGVVDMLSMEKLRVDIEIVENLVVPAFGKYAIE